MDKVEILKQLETFGFAIQKNIISHSECNKMIKSLEEIKNEKIRNKKLWNTKAQIQLFNVHLEKPEIFLNKIDIPKVMNVVSKVLREDFILSNFNASKSGVKGGNRIHIDSRIPTSDFKNTIQIAVLLCLDEFNSENGATIVYPFSHKSGMDPRDLRGKKVEGAIQACAPKGSAIYTLGQTWHDVGPNLKNKRRWGIIAYYSRWWIKPTYDFTKCGQEIYARLTTRQKALFGFNTRPPTDAYKRTHTVISVKDLPDNYNETLSL